MNTMAAAQAKITQKIRPLQFKHVKAPPPVTKWK
jgi:hypothetical protein